MNVEHVFRTSGSTQAPRQWRRTRRQMEQEARMILGTWATGVTDILAFAPIEHSYGMILGQIGAEVTQARLQCCSLETLRLPDLQVRGPTVILCIASTWTLLTSLLKRLAPQVPVLVLHSASALPSKAYGVVSRFVGQGVTFIELLGSTETGAIAHRPVSETPMLWTLFDDVSLLSPVGAESRLSVRSPRIARAVEDEVAATSHQSDDWIIATGPGQFEWLGRASQLIKINGVRQDLGVLCADLSAVTQCQHLACVPLRDEVRGEAYEIVFSSPTLSAASITQAIERLGRHVTAYLSGHTSQREQADAVPDFLRLPLRQRYLLVQQQPQLRHQWARQYNQWAGSADSQYRCLISSLTDDSVLFRMGVKDTVDVAGLPTRLGLRSYRHYPDVSASALSSLQPDVRVLFKVATTELNIGFGCGARNPLYPSIDPSGSSTGSAVAVAAGLCDISLGTDVLGSVRWPAAHCGMVGLRMTHKASNLDGVFPLSPSMDALGWVTRTADDLDFLMPMLGIGQHLGEQKPLAETYRVGVLSHIDEHVTSAPMLAMMQQAKNLLADMGLPQVPMQLPALWANRGAAWQLCARDAWLASQVWREIFDTDLHWSTQAALDVGAAVSDTEHRQITERMQSVRAGIDQCFEDAGVDVVVFPVDPCRPFDVRRPLPGDSTIPSPTDPDYAQKIGFTPLASFSGLPAITLPIMLSADGKAPLALQMMGRRDSELQLIDLAKRLEALRGPLPAAAIDH